MASRMSVIVPAGQRSALSSATASSATARAFPGRSMATTASQPAVSCWRPKLLGKLRDCTSPLPVAVASTPPPVSTIVWVMLEPSLLANSWWWRRAASDPWRVVTPGTSMAASAASRSSILVSSDTVNGSISTGVA